MSYRIKIDPRSAKYALFAQSVRDEIIRAISEEVAKRQISKCWIAEQLDVSPSVITRRLTGRSNLTLRSIADFATVLDKEIVFELRSPDMHHNISLAPPARSEPPVFQPPELGVITINMTEEATIASSIDAEVSEYAVT